MEKVLESKNTPLEVVLECLSIREHRISIDLVRDEVEAELNKVCMHNSKLGDLHCSFDSVRSLK